MFEFTFHLALVTTRRRSCHRLNVDAHRLAVADFLFQLDKLSAVLAEKSVLFSNFSVLISNFPAILIHLDRTMK